MESVIFVLFCSINRIPLRGEFFIGKNYKLAPVEPPVYRKNTKVPFRLHGSRLLNGFTHKFPI